VEFCFAQQLAAATHWTPVTSQTETDAHNESLQSRSSTNSNHDNWFKVLGLEKSASIAEVRKAYKALIKQNHPDRVQDMSPAFRKLAETETKKLNTAFRQALSRVPQ
jgi:DnaJ-domain-containing protein 1